MAFRMTTSWDDGHILDLRLAEMLANVGLKGTFYVTRDYLDERLSDTHIRELAQFHEIGAHTLTHPSLTSVTPEQARDEIVGSKAWLEDLLGQEVKAFCYPKGRYNPHIQRIVEEAGYTMARTVKAYSLHEGVNRFQMPTTLHLYPFPLRPMPDVIWWRGWRTKSFPIRHALAPTLRHGLSLADLRSWRTMAEALLHKAVEQGGVWHLWGHSWEIEMYKLWDDFAAILQVAKTYHESAVVNSDLVS